MKLDVSVSHRLVITPRVDQVCGIFDLPRDCEQKRTWTADIPIEERDWNIGLIVGPSGSGKTTIARHLFGDRVKCADDWSWSDDRSVVDDFPSSMSVHDIVEALCRVGFSSPPHWLRPFSTLSNGEKFRVGLARMLCEGGDLTVCDEYSSVVDRTVARVASDALAKYVRRTGRKFVACSCHDDVEDWLQPDWIFRPAEMAFHWRCLQRRPRVNLEIVRCENKAWEMFRPYHYLSGHLQPGAMSFMALWNGKPVCFSSWLFESRKNKYINSVKMCREHRTVCLPDYQGIGIGSALSTWCAALFKTAGYSVFSVTSHPAMVHARLSDGRWEFRQKKLTASGRKDKFLALLLYTRVRGVYSFHYVGPGLPARYLGMLE